MSSAQRIVVAEDDDVLRRLLEHVLKKEGYAVLAVADGQQALDLVRNRRPDAIILDAMMPEMDGYELLHIMRREQALSDIPVLMLSARALDSDVVSGFNFGANDYLIKPFKPEELVLRLKRLLRSSNQ